MRPHIGHLRFYVGVFKEANSKLHWESKGFKSQIGKKNKNVTNLFWANRTPKTRLWRAKNLLPNQRQ